MSGGRWRKSLDVDEESYFISMSDLMVGLLFVFMILLVYFSLQFRLVKSEYEGGVEARSDLVAKIGARIRDRGIPVDVDPDRGIIRLPEGVLFASGQYKLNAEGRANIRVIAEELVKGIPCYTFPRPKSGCENSTHTIEALYVEGHTDSDNMRDNGFIRDNLDLAAMRGTNTFRALVAAEPALRDYKNGEDGAAQPILSSSAYGSARPVKDESQPGGKAANRRIDLRFLMKPPKGDEGESNYDPIS